MKQRLIPFIFVNVIQYPRTLNDNIYHSSKWEPPPFFHLDTNNWPRSGPLCWQNSCSGCNSGTDLVAGLEYIFFNFVPTPNKSLGFSRFRRSYVNCSAVVLTNHCLGYAAFLLDVRCLKWTRFFFFGEVCPQWFCVTYFCWAHMLLECC